jgi:hypothetical protein
LLVSPSSVSHVIHSFNTEENNKRNDALLCDQVRRSQARTLNYNFGSFDSWRQHIVNGVPTSPCDSSIITGTYDQGSTPHPTLYTDPTGAIGVATVHYGVPPLKAPSGLDAGCGVANVYNGVVLDGWPIPTDV